MYGLARHTLWAMVVALLVARLNPAAADSGGNVLDFGVQPVSFPVAMFTEAMKHDRILQTHLAGAGWVMRQHPYFKGTEMIDPVGDGRLEAAVLGDIPTLYAVTRHELCVAALMKHSFSSVVTRRYMPLTDLKGQRIGNAFGSSAHYTLLEGLAAAGLSDKDVELVEMTVSDMPGALETGKIEAFSAWEPAPTIALTKNPNTFVAYRGLNNTYLVLNRKFTDAQPLLARQFLAAFARAFHWMKKSPDNLRRAAEWSVQADDAFSGRPTDLTVEQAMAIARQESLDVPGLPALPRNETSPSGRMAKQLDFLKRLAMVPATASWDKVSASFTPHLMGDILGQPGRYQVHAFDYAL